MSSTIPYTSIDLSSVATPGSVGIYPVAPIQTDSPIIKPIAFDDSKKSIVNSVPTTVLITTWGYNYGSKAILSLSNTAVSILNPGALPGFVIEYNSPSGILPPALVVDYDLAYQPQTGVVSVYYSFDQKDWSNAPDQQPGNNGTRIPMNTSRPQGVPSVVPFSSILVVPKDKRTSPLYVMWVSSPVTPGATYYMALAGSITVSPYLI